MAEEEAAPALEEVPPALEEVPPALEEVPPALEEVPPALEEVPPAVEEVLPAVAEVLPVVEEVLPVVEDVPPAVEEAPVLTPAPVTLEEKIEVPVVLEETPPVPAPEVIVATPDITPEILGAAAITEFFEDAATEPAPPLPSIVEEVKKMAPQKYADLGKEARDLISKNFHFGAVKLEAKTKGENGVHFTTEGSHNTDTGNVAASLETKFKYAPYGVTFTEKWNTDNVISSTIALENTKVEGLKIDLDTTFAPFTGKKSAKVKTAYQHSDFLHATADVDFADLTGPTLHGSGVLAYKGWHGGYQASYDIANSKLLDNKFSLTYKKGDLVVHTGIVNASTYVGSIHHQVNKDVSVAALLDWASDLSTFTLCGKYAVGDDTFVKAKVDNSLHVGLAFAQKLRPSLWLTMSGLFNAKSLEQGGHKVGLSLNFEA